MTWTALLPIIAQYGLPFAEKLWTLAQGGGEPTAQQWAELRSLAGQTARSQMLDALNRAGIPVDSPEAAVFLQLVP